MNEKFFLFIAKYGNLLEGIYWVEDLEIYMDIKRDI